MDPILKKYLEWIAQKSDESAETGFDPGKEGGDETVESTWINIGQYGGKLPILDKTIKLMEDLGDATKFPDYVVMSPATIKQMPFASDEEYIGDVLSGAREKNITIMSKAFGVPVIEDEHLPDNTYIAVTRPGARSFADQWKEKLEADIAEATREFDWKPVHPWPSRYYAEVSQPHHYPMSVEVEGITHSHIIIDELESPSRNLEILYIYVALTSLIGIITGVLLWIN